jgi:nucleoside diphosphate-linked moiety X motif protein 19
MATTHAARAALRKAATVLVVAPTKRAGLAEDYQLLMVKRASKNRFMAGAHVFPGGILEGSDSCEGWHKLIASSPSAHQRSAISADELATRIAAIRELFEECGVLLTLPPASGAELSKWRELSTKDSSQFLRMFTTENELRNHCPDVHALVPWAHWVTPEEEEWRYDTAFYLVVLPHSPQAQEDDKEITHINLFSPTEALHAFEDEKISLPPPTWFILKELSQFKSLDSLRKTALKGRDLTPVQPSLVHTDEGMVVAMPGDPLHWASTGKKSEVYNRILVRPRDPLPSEDDGEDEESIPPKASRRLARYKLVQSAL